MVKRNSKTRTSRGLVSRVGSPLFHLMNATGETIGVVAGTAGNVAKRTVRGVSNTGRIWTSHVNMAAKNIVGRGGSRRNTRRARKTRRGSRRA